MFNPDAYGEEVARILALDGNGRRLMPLAGGRCSSERALQILRQTSGVKLLGKSRAPEAAFAGLYLYFSCWDEAHAVAQDIPTADGSYWHAIVHRQEPDAGNAGYWFHRVGNHAAFPALRERAATAGMNVGTRWDPFAFIEFCEQARRRPGSARKRRSRWKCNSPNGNCCSISARLRPEAPEPPGLICVYSSTVDRSFPPGRAECGSLLLPHGSRRARAPALAAPRFRRSE